MWKDEGESQSQKSFDLISFIGNNHKCLSHRVIKHGLDLKLALGRAPILREPIQYNKDNTSLMLPKNEFGQNAKDAATLVFFCFLYYLTTSNNNI